MIKNLSNLAAGSTSLALAAAISVTANAELAKPDAPESYAVSSYILLDRTGSMNDIWDEALTSVNTYAKAVGTAEDGEVNDLKTTVTLAAFDYQGGFQFDVLRNAVEPESWQTVTNSEVTPRGMTPLFDAINQMITLAEVENPEKAVIVIMTDGLENSSSEVTKDGAKAALKRAEERGWEVVFLGAEFATFADADAVGVSRDRQMAVGASNLLATQERLAKKARSYGRGEEAEIIFDAEDRAAADEEGVKQRNGGR
ncbi:MAG: vWA domain-containing protein [Pseudomonadota bacterium]